MILLFFCWSHELLAGTIPLFRISMTFSSFSLQMKNDPHNLFSTAGRKRNIAEEEFFVRMLEDLMKFMIVLQFRSGFILCLRRRQSKWNRLEYKCLAFVRFIAKFKYSVAYLLNDLLGWARRSHGMRRMNLWNAFAKCELTGVEQLLLYIAYGMMEIVPFRFLNFITISSQQHRLIYSSE